MQCYQETRIGRLDDSLAKHYYICGGKGGLKRININPEMIDWESCFGFEG